MKKLIAQKIEITLWVHEGVDNHMMMIIQFDVA